jgi:hypothetical protein
MSRHLVNAHDQEALTELRQKPKMAAIADEVDA